MIVIVAVVVSMMSWWWIFVLHEMGLFMFFNMPEPKRLQHYEKIGNNMYLRGSRKPQ